MLAHRIVTVLAMLAAVYAVHSVLRHVIGRWRGPSSLPSTPSALLFAAGAVTTSLFLFSGVSALAAWVSGVLTIAIAILELLWPKQCRKLALLGLTIAWLASLQIGTAAYRNVRKARVELQEFASTEYGRECAYSSTAADTSDASLGCIGVAFLLWRPTMYVTQWPYLLAKSSFVILDQ